MINISEYKRPYSRAVVVAKLKEWSLPTPEVYGSNPVISNIYIEHLFTVNCIEKTKIKKKRPGMALLKKDDQVQPNPSNLVKLGTKPQLTSNKAIDHTFL